MNRITLVREKTHGRAESFKTDDQVYCVSRDGSKSLYEIDSDYALGSGGNAIVYGCKNIGSGESCAIKIQIDTRSPRLQRFKREERLLFSLHHEQLMPSVGHGEIKLESEQFGKRKHPFIIMPLAESNLFDFVKNERENLSFDQIAGQFRGLSEALAVLHEHAIHRDIKPENILIRGETWMLSDFGLCRFIDPEENGADVTMDNEKIGPVFWMSPESMNRSLGRGDEITKASDVFQLASVFWFSATGRHPTGIVRETDWHGPSSVFKVLESALSHDPSQRPADGKAFHEQIATALLDA